MDENKIQSNELNHDSHQNNCDEKLAGGKQEKISRSFSVNDSLAENIAIGRKVVKSFPQQNYIKNEATFERPYNSLTSQNQTYGKTF